MFFTSLLSIISLKYSQTREFLFYSEFKSSFLFLIGTTYFMQGFRNYSFGDGIIWFYSHTFHLDPGPTQVYMSMIGITWAIKMVYGLIFDNFPLLGLHDKPWMIISTLISVLGFFGLGVVSLSDTPVKTAACFWFALMVFSRIISGYGYGRCDC